LQYYVAVSQEPAIETNWMEYTTRQAVIEPIYRYLDIYRSLTSHAVLESPPNSTGSRPVHRWVD